MKTIIKTSLNSPSRNKTSLLSIFILLIVLFNACQKKIHNDSDYSDSQISHNDIMMESAFFKENETLGGDVMILNAKLETNSSNSQKIFHIESHTDDALYLSVWINSPEVMADSKMDFLSYDIKINGEFLPVKLNISKAGWHVAPYIDELGNRLTVNLKKGLNQVVFSCKGNVTPAIDFVRFNKDKNYKNVQDEAYDRYLANVKSQSQNRSSFAHISDTINNPVIMAVEPASNPLYEFDYYLNQSFSYTYYSTFYYNSGQKVTLTSTSAALGDFTHVLEFFSVDNPSNHSWTSLSNSLGKATVSVTIPSTGNYYIRLRSFTQGKTGLVNLNINNAYFYNNCVASGFFGKRSPHNGNQVYNYFTSNSVGDPRLWIEDNSVIPGRIIGFNDDYNSSGNFHWGLNSRIKKRFNIYVGAALVSSYSAYNPTGTTDLYLRNRNGDIMPYFPNLKADDAIMSSSGSNVYNCTAWTGGFTSFWFWGSTPSYYYGSGFVWNTWDNYYGNNPQRYNGAVSYTSSAANATNGVIAMWALSNGEITHGSIRKPGNNHAHGYDWESKPGSLSRTFHPRDALEGSAYGKIVKYYKEVSPSVSISHSFSGAENLSFDESVKQGLTIIENVNLSNMDRSKLSSQQNLLMNGTKNIQQLYNKWSNRMNSDDYKHISNPYKFIDLKEGQDLLLYGKENLAEAVVFFSNIIFGEKHKNTFEQSISHYMFWQIAKDEYGFIMENIKENWRKNKFNHSNAYIAPLPETFTKKYIKEILEKM